MVVWLQNDPKYIGRSPGDLMADWELWLAAATQDQKRVSYSILLTQEMIKIQNLKYPFY